jgi:hypothetical protein
LDQQCHQPLACASFEKQQQQRELVDQMDQVGLRLAYFVGKAHLDLLALHALALCPCKALIRYWLVPYHVLGLEQQVHQ